MDHKIINLLHIFVIVPIFFFLYKERKDLSTFVCSIIIFVSLGAMFYHLSKAVEETNKMKWVNLIHVLFVFPLLLWIGYNCKETERKYFEMLLLLAFGALGYHAYNYLVY